MITLTDEMTVLNQYILACQTLDKHLLPTKTDQEQALALKAAIDECIAKGYLKEYFIEHMEEVLSMLGQYYRDLNYIEAGRLIELEDARNEGVAQTQEFTTLQLLQVEKMPAARIVQVFGYPQELVARVAREHNIPI